LQDNPWNACAIASASVQGARGGIANSKPWHRLGEEWDNTIGGSAFDDVLLSVIQTSDGGYLLGGRSDSPASGDKTENSLGGNDYWVVKLDASGAVQWDNTIGGSSMMNPVFRDPDERRRLFVGRLFKFACERR
jgi:hypothetical protein